MQRSRPATPSAAPPGAGSPTVLVVDDEAAFCASVGALLEDEGYRVLCVDNGRAALDVMETSRPSLVLLDLAMPVMSGWDVLHALDARDDLSDIPVVVVSASVAPGARMCLSKPLDPRRLLRVVEHYCASATD